MSLLWVATLRAESWALIRVLRSARLRHVSLTWLLSPLLARDTSDRPAVIFQPPDSYTCGAIPLEHRHVSSQLGPGGQWLQQRVGPTAPRRAASGHNYTGNWKGIGNGITWAHRHCTSGRAILVMHMRIKTQWRARINYVDSLFVKRCGGVPTHEKFCDSGAFCVTFEVSNIRSFAFIKYLAMHISAAFVA